MSMDDVPIPPCDDALAVCLLPSGRRFRADALVTLWQAARDAGVRLPSSCRNGTCRTCLSRLVEGQVVYHIDWPGLSAEEKAQGWILPCVAYPTSDIVLEAGPVDSNSEATPS